MKRTNIYLTDEEHRILRERAGAAGVSMAQVVRDILDRHLGLVPSHPTLDEAIAASASVWADRSDGEMKDLRRFRAGDRFVRPAD